MVNSYIIRDKTGKVKKVSKDLKDKVKRGSVISDSEARNLTDTRTEDQKKRASSKKSSDEVVKKNTYQVTTKEGVVVERTLTTYKSGRQTVADKEINIKNEPRRIVEAYDSEAKPGESKYKNIPLSQMQAKELSEAQRRSGYRSSIKETDTGYAYTTYKKDSSSLNQDSTAQSGEAPEKVKSSFAYISDSPGASPPQNFNTYTYGDIGIRETKAPASASNSPFFIGTPERSSSYDVLNFDIDKKEQFVEDAGSRASFLFSGSDMSFKSSVSRTQDAIDYVGGSVALGVRDFGENVYTIVTKPGEVLAGVTKGGAEFIRNPSKKSKEFLSGTQESFYSNPLRFSTEQALNFYLAPKIGSKTVSRVKNVYNKYAFEKAINTPPSPPGAPYVSKVDYNIEVGGKVYGEVNIVGQRTLKGTLADESLLLPKSSSVSPLGLPEEVSSTLTKKSNFFDQYVKGGEVGRKSFISGDSNFKIYDPHSKKLIYANPSGGSQTALREPSLRLQDVTTGKEYTVKQSAYKPSSKVFESGEPVIRPVGYEDNFFNVKASKPIKSFESTTYEPILKDGNLYELVKITKEKPSFKPLAKETQTNFKKAEVKPQSTIKEENSFLYAELVPGQTFIGQQLGKIDFKASFNTVKEIGGEAGSLARSTISNTPRIVPGAVLLSTSTLNYKNKAIPSYSYVLNDKSLIEEKPKKLTTPVLNLKVDETNELNLKDFTRTLNKQDQKRKQDQKTDSFFISSSDSAIKQEVEYKQDQKTENITDSPVSTETKSFISNKPFFLQKTSRTPKPPFSTPKLNDLSQKKFSKGFVAVDVKGRKISPVLTRQGALSYGSEKINRSALRSFKIVPSFQKPVRTQNEKSSFFNPKRFYKNKKGFFVEKSKYAIDTPEERGEITFKGLSTIKFKNIKNRR